jgi:hypothetical protein
MPDAIDVHCEQLRDAVRERIGEHAKTFTHSVDVMVDEVMRYWPEKEFARIARTVEEDRSSGAEAIGAMAVVVAKCRENLEARWGAQPSHVQAIDLLIEPVVIQLANIWFSNNEARIAMREVIARLRNPLPKNNQKRVDGGGKSGGKPPL